jgi:hypothetical protein
MIFAVIFEIVIQWAVGDEPYHLIKNTLIIAILYNRSGKTYFHFKARVGSSKIFYFNNDASQELCP